MNDRYTPIPDELDPDEQPAHHDDEPAGGRELAAAPSGGAPALGDPSLYLICDGDLYRLDVDVDAAFAAMDERTTRIALTFLEMSVDRAMRRLRDHVDEGAGNV